jgi:hypothetical protein
MQSPTKLPSSGRRSALAAAVQLEMLEVRRLLAAQVWKID